MPVNTRHSSYVANLDKWTRARDCADGSDAVKAKGDAYLPRLSSHKRELPAITYTSAYEDYLKRALFYNATGRTVEGFAGAIFQREPVWKFPNKDMLLDVTRTGVSAEMFALKATRQILTTGRYGILTEMPEIEQPSLVQRVFGAATPPPSSPYWVGYVAEDIVNWDTARIDGDVVLAWLVLREHVLVADPKDRFKLEMVEQYRMLEIENGVYTQATWVPKKDVKDEWVEDRRVTVTRRGKPLTFIPFSCVGPTSVAMDVEKPPLIDLVDVNLSHYRTMADLEHGRHFTALPQPWVAGMAKEEDGPLGIGGDEVWLLAEGGSAGMLEYSGSGLSSLENAESGKRAMMATLGARLLEEQSDVQETAQAVRMRHSGTHATLRTTAQAVEQGLSQSLQWLAWWDGVAAEPADTKALCELNKDFFAMKMTPLELQALVAAIQAETISFKTFYAALQRGEYARPGVTAEQERAEIEKDSPPPVEGELPPPGGGAPPSAGGQPPPPAKPPAPGQ